MTKRRGNREGTILQRKNGSWMAQITLSLHLVTGKPVRRTVYGKTRKDAQAKLDAMKRAQAEGTLRAPDRTTVADWAQEYLSNAQGRLKAGTYQSYELNMRLYVLPHLGRIRLEKLTARDVAGMVDTLAREKGARTSQYARTLTSMMLNYAVALDVVPRNVTKNTRPPKASRQEMAFWHPPKIRTFLQAAQRHRLESLSRLALSTGMRKAELLGIRWTDLRGDTLSIRQTVVRLGYVPHVDTPKTVAGCGTSCWTRRPCRDCVRAAWPTSRSGRLRGSGSRSMT